MLAGFFSPPPDPAEQMKKWKMELIKQQRQLDHEIRGIELEEAKVKRQIKDAAKRNDNVVARTLAKELVRSRKSKERLYTSKAQMNSVVMSLRSHMGTTWLLFSRCLTGFSSSHHQNGEDYGQECRNHDMYVFILVLPLLT